MEGADQQLQAWHGRKPSFLPVSQPFGCDTRRRTASLFKKRPFCARQSGHEASPLSKTRRYIPKLLNPRSRHLSRALTRDDRLQRSALRVVTFQDAFSVTVFEPRALSFSQILRRSRGSSPLVRHEGAIRIARRFEHVRPEMIQLRICARGHTIPTLSDLNIAARVLALGSGSWRGLKQENEHQHNFTCLSETSTRD